MRLTMTDEMRARIAAVKDALAMHDHGGDDRSYTELVELPKIELADALLRAVDEQMAAQAEQLAALPRRRAAVARLATRRSRRA